ncbi:MAG: hypothetical protein ABIZ56_00420 [Chthoniobacteraceae bacterium]
MKKLILTITILAAIAFSSTGCAGDGHREHADSQMKSAQAGSPGMKSKPQ